MDFNLLANKISGKYKRGESANEIAYWMSKLLNKRVSFVVANFFLDCTNSFEKRNENIINDYYNNNFNICDLAIKYDTSQQEIYHVIKKSPQFKELAFKLREEKMELENGDEIIEDYKKKKYTLNQLGEKYGWSSVKIKQYLIYKGVYVYRNKRKV